MVLVAEVSLALALGLSQACESPPPPVAPAPRRERPGAGEFPEEPGPLLRYHSARFKLSVPLPDGRLWKIDDHHDRALVARHASTRSTLTVLTFTDPELVNRQRCQERAIETGLLSLHDPRTIEDETTIGPDAFDSRIWIALEPGASPGVPVTGHALLIGGFVHKCLFVHYVTDVASEKDEPTLTARLAVARLRILGGVRMEPFDAPTKMTAPGE
jgi:hypothetical protein